jgi:tetratricopeptide (TPR) repeat protein
LSQVNRFDEARAAYERAIKSSNPFAAQTALSKLGAMLNAQGDTSGARNAYAAAADSGNSDLAPYGAYLLGCSRGTPDATGREPQGEREAFQQAIDSGHPEFAPRTAFEFGKILNDRANYAEARTRLDYAIKSGHPTYSPQGAYQLADMLRKNQNFADAREAYEQVIDVGHGLAAQAATDLGDMLHSNGDYVAADVAYRRAITLKEPRDAYELGIKLASQGYTETAQAAFESAADRAGDIYSPAARLAIEHLSELQSDLNGSNGKIIIKCLTTFGVSNASVTVYINGSPHVARFNAASIVQEVSPGVQLIGRSAADDLKTSGGSIVFYLPPGKSGYLECRWRYTGPEFTLGRIR